MTPKKVPANDLDRALMALVKSKSALPRFLRELGTGELWFVTPYHPEIIDGTVEIENGMRSPFAELQDADGPYVPVFSSYERLEESLMAHKVPAKTYAAASMEAELVLELLGKMEIRGMINTGCKTGAIYLPPDMMRRVADGSAFEPPEPTGETKSRMMNIIDPADYPTDLLQPVFEILKQHRNFRAAWVMAELDPEDEGTGGPLYQFAVHMDPQDADIFHEFNQVLNCTALTTGDRVECGRVDGKDMEYLANLWQDVQPFYVAADHERPGD